MLPYDPITVAPQSRYSAIVGDYTLRETETTRLVLRAELVRNQNERDNAVKFIFIHQRRASGNLAWQDAAPFRLSELRSGQEVRLHLDTRATRALYDRLGHLFTLFVTHGLPTLDKKTYEVVDPDAVLVLRGKERETLAALLAQEGDHFWQHLEDLRPGLLEAVQLKRRHEKWRRAVTTFEQRLAPPGWPEADWQKFFQNNTWIFGHSLNYIFLHLIKNQPDLGAADVLGHGGQRSDYLFATKGGYGFAVLVDIKKPETPLISQEYRNRIFGPSRDLSGGAAQLQAYCQRLEITAHSSEQDFRALDKERVGVFQPRGILVAGHLNQLGDDDKRRSFELFRRNLLNPTVLTYDEVLARAKFMITTDGSDAADPTV